MYGDNSKLRVAIIGAGMGGLTCAAALRNIDNVQVHVYEAAHQIAEIGAGITLWPRTWAALQQMGLEELLCEALQYKPSDESKLVFEYRKGDDPQGGYIDKAFVKGGLRSFHRYTLQQTLYNSLPETIKNQTHLNHRLISYKENPDSITLNFQNGETAECDLLIGADGIKSVVRTAIHQRFGPNAAQPIWLGRFCFRGLVSAESLKRVAPNHRALTTPLNYMGKHAHVLLYPISNNTIINVVANYSVPGKEGTVLDGPASREATKEEMMAHYADWDPEVLAVLNCIEKPLKWASQALRPLDTYSTGRIALVGDAAHSMASHLGGGASQAIEDAWILATLIANIPCTRENVPVVLKRYNEIRRPCGNRILQNSTTQGHYYELSAPEFDGLEHLSDEQYTELGRLIRKGLTWGEDPQPLLADGKRAMRLVD